MMPQPDTVTPEQATSTEILHLDARPMLVIGLGTTGAKVCNQILERINWTYGAPAAVPWLKCVVLDTAEPPAGKLVRQHGTFIHTSLDDATYSNIINNAQSYQSQLDFASWNIPQLTTSHSAISDGAGGIRLLGRLAFLHQSNLTRIRGAITGALQELRTLTTEEASQAFGKACRRRVQVHFAGGGQANSAVYVVGSTCGGTASGSMIDLGYLLQRLEQDGLPNESCGLFLLPPPDAAQGKDTANSYQTLVELNHYSSPRTRYSVQYPDQPGLKWQPAMRGTRPYRWQYLIQADPGVPAEVYARLISVSADFVYADLVGSAGMVRNQKRIDIARYLSAPDFEGASQTFMNFGLSTIEFPLLKVTKGCVLRLTGLGYANLAGGEELSPNARARAAAALPLLGRQAATELLLNREMDGLPPLDRTVRAILVDALDAAQSSPDAIPMAQAQINTGFGREGEGQAQHADLRAACVTLTIDTNTSRLEAKLRDGIKEQLRETVLDGPNYGLKATGSLLEEIREALVRALKDADATSDTSVGDGLQETMADALYKMEACRRDWCLGTVAMRQMAVRRYLREYMAAANEFYCDYRFRPLVARKRVQIYRSLHTWVEKVIERVANVRDEATAIQQEMAGVYAGVNGGAPSLDGWTRVHNGHEVYTAGEPVSFAAGETVGRPAAGTIDTEYAACLRARDDSQALSFVERNEARAAIRQRSEEVFAAICAPEYHATSYDNASEQQRYGEERLLDLCQAARSVFAGVADISVLQRLWSGNNMNSVVPSVQAKAKYLLAWQINSRYRAEGQKQSDFVFYPQLDPAGRKFLAAIDASKRGPTDRRFDINYPEPHQVLFLREHGAFSLGTIDVLDQASPRGWWIQSQIAGQDLDCRSRGDVSTWVTWASTRNDDYQELRAEILVAVANGAIEQVSAQKYKFSYTPTGPADPGFIDLSYQMELAVETVRTTGKAPLLRQQIAAVRTRDGVPQFIDNLIRMIREGGSFKEDDRILEPSHLEGILSDYARKDSDLLDEYNRRYPDNSLLRMLGDPNRVTSEAEGPQMEGWYYCPYCNKRLGRSRDALFVRDELTGKMEFRCACCGHLLG